MKINDKVKGTYYRIPFEGVIRAFDNARIYVDFSYPIAVFGSLRNGAAVDRFNPEGHSTVELVESGEEVECIHDAEFGGVTRKK